MYSVTQTTMMCLKVSIPDAQTVSREEISKLAKELAQEAEKLIAAQQLFYLSCNNVNYFPYPSGKDSYTSLAGVIEHFIYKSITTEGDAFVSLLKNQSYPPQWSCTILLRELYVAVVMQGCQLSVENHQQLLDIINSKLRYYEESKNIFGTIGSPIEDSTARTLLSVYGYMREGNLLTREYLVKKVN